MENFTPEKIQKELSPETVEKTMEKVFDIDTKGTAYSSIGAVDTMFTVNDFPIGSKQEKETQDREWNTLKEKAQKVLSDGFIGISKKDTEEANYKNKEKYIEHAKERKISIQYVYANIVGRSEGESDKIYATEIGNSNWISGVDFSVVVVFDKDFFEEDEPKRNNLKRSLLKDKWKFSTDDPQVVYFYEKAKKIKPEIIIGDESLKNYGENATFGLRGKGFDEDGKPHPSQDYGFVFFPRVPKRTFKGLVVKIPKDEQYDQRIQEVADAVIESNLEIPIYDTDGNVLWPKKMSFGEVKRSIRDKYKEKQTTTK